MKRMYTSGKKPLEEKSERKKERGGKEKENSDKAIKKDPKTG